MSDSDSGKPFWSEGLQFSCTSCGHCCRHEPGYVFLSKKDLKALCRHTNLSQEEFTARYCRKVDLGLAMRLSLIETPENDCIFWDNGCTVYEARPLQCRTYPFWAANLGSREEWTREAGDCPGINQGRVHSAGEIESALKARERDVLISPAR